MTGRGALAGIVASLVAGCAAGRAGPASPWEKGTVEVVTSRGRAEVEVRIASSARQREIGLRGVSDLGENEGMWFAFEVDQPGDQGPWMSGVPFPVSVAFVDSRGTIVAIREMEPCGRLLGLGCPRYAPGASYRAALEAPPELFQRAGARLGDRLRLVEKR